MGSAYGGGREGEYGGGEGRKGVVLKGERRSWVRKKRRWEGNGSRWGWLAERVEVGKEGSEVGKELEWGRKVVEGS